MRSSVVEPYSSVDGKTRGTSFRHPSDPRLSKSKQQIPPAKRSKRRLRLLPAEGLLPLGLLAIAVYSLVLSIMSANYVGQTFILPGSAGAGLLIGLLVAKIRRMPQAIMHLAACLVGHWLSVWLTSVFAFHISWLVLLDGLRIAITGGLSAGAIPNSEVVFLFYLSFLCFFLGYFGAWLTYHAHLPWLVALVYTSILLANLSYGQQDQPLLVIVLLAALLLLIARVQLIKQLEQWKHEGLHTDRTWLRAITLRCMNIACVLTLLALLISWVLPIQSRPTAGASFWDQLNNAWTNILHGNVSLQDPGSIVLPYQAPVNFFDDHLSISGSVNLPTGEVLYYTGTHSPQYLEGFTYDHFDGHIWTTTFSPTPQSFQANTPLPLDPSGAQTSQATTAVTIVQPPEGLKHYLFAPAQPSSFDVATNVYGNNVLSTAWTQQSSLVPGERYKVVSYLPASTSQELARVPLPQDDQNMWLNDTNAYALQNYYLQMPQDISPRVSQTVQQWTSGAMNAYAALISLESHLSDAKRFTYSVTNAPIPGTVDVVDWLLQTRRGYCTYYATAMTVMARMLGIPARVVNGFSGGHFDLGRHVWVVNGDDAHSWVQAYLPGFGWVTFDPTPGFSPSSSNGPNPSASPTPTRPPVAPSPTTGTRPTSGAHPTPVTPTHPAPGTPSGAATDGGQQNLLLGVSLALVLFSLLVLLIAVVRYWWRNLYADSPLIPALYWRICRIARWAGLGPQQWQTPYEYGRVLGQKFPREAAPLWRLTQRYVQDRWSAPQQAPLAEEELTQLSPNLGRMIWRSLWLRIRRK